MDKRDTSNTNMQETEVATKTRHLWPLLVFVIVAVGAAYLFREHLSFESLAANRTTLLRFTQDHAVVAAVMFVAIYTVIVALSLPGATVATLTGGFLFGVFPGALFNIVGATLGATMLFLAARWGLGDWLSAKIDASEGRIHKIKQGIDENQWSMLFLIRLVPVVPFFVANLLPALLGVSLMRFVISTALGIVPGAVVYTSVGAGLGSVFERGETPNLGIIFEPQILLPILGLCLLALIPVILKALRKEAL